MPVPSPFENMIVSELRRLAAERNIPGRSEMTKDELVRALDATRAEDLTGRLDALEARVEALEQIQTTGGTT